MHIKKSRTGLFHFKIPSSYKAAPPAIQHYQGSLLQSRRKSFTLFSSAVFIFFIAGLFTPTSFAAGEIVKNLASNLPLLSTASPSDKSSALTCNQSFSTTLNTDFEGRMSLSPFHDGQHLRFSGQDGFNVCLDKSKSDSNLTPALSLPVIQFQGGDESSRFATIEADPQNIENKTLLFGLRSPNVPSGKPNQFKGRVQMNVYGNTAVRQLKMSVRMFLHADMELVRSFPGPVNWLTISEWWNNAGWTGEGYPFRVSINLVKESAGRYSPLMFHVQSETLDQKTRRWSNVVWKHTADNFVVPTGRWIDLEYGYKEGDASQGRFFMAATVEGGKRIILFDIKNFTHHPGDPSPNGLTHFNPLKLYTSGRLIDHVRENGGVMQIYWDDLKLMACSEGNQNDCNIN
jgi:hypothetical protein